MLKQTFIALLSRFTDDVKLINQHWDEIEQYYSSTKRFYHTLAHLEHMLGQLLEVKEEIQDWNAVLFALYYHDIIYDPLKSDNEEQSALFGAERMKQIGVPAQSINDCKVHILATKHHREPSHSDTAYFMDIDLSILGQPWEMYVSYYKKIRMEYAVYPDLVYNIGRRKVLNNFLAMDRIFKTDVFYNKFEAQAKHNISRELNLL